MSLFDNSLFRIYDIRGVYPTQMNEEVAYAAGQAFVKVMAAKNVVVGRDVRQSGDSLQQALIRGVIDAGANVIDIGVISTELLYFASATLECAGGMSLTASHNPSEWNGIKFIAKGAIPLTGNGKLEEIYQFMRDGTKIEQFEKGKVTQRDLLSDYKNFLRPFFPADLPKLKIVANVNFGANGKVVDAVGQDLPLEIVRLNWKEDGTFPKGTPDPSLPSNRQEISQTIIKEQAHFGVAWDADADRIFFYDEKGRFFHGYYLTALLIRHFLQHHPGETIVVERRLAWAYRKAVEEGEGKLVLSRTGHAFLKYVLRANQGIFAGEISGHYYFRDFFFADNGLITFLTVLGIFGQKINQGGTVSQLLDPYLKEFPIVMNEMNYLTNRAAEIIKTFSDKYKDGKQDHEDGISIDYPTWRCNVRMSDNEPVMRLNLEAATNQELEIRLKELSTFIEGFGATLRDDQK